jgi:hypothetical protein
VTTIARRSQRDISQSFYVLSESRIAKPEPPSPDPERATIPPVPIPFRSDLKTFLTEFAEQHRGIRLGKMFGLPAGYAGRRLFACVMEDGLIVRLPDDAAKRELRGRAVPFSRRGKVMGTWVMYRPRTLADARRLVPVLETAARHIAQAQQRVAR